MQGGSNKIRNRKFENLCHAVNKAIDVQLQSQHQLMDSERDRLLKQYFLDQMVCRLSSFARGLKPSTHDIFLILGAS